MSMEAGNPPIAGPGLVLHHVGLLVADVAVAAAHYRDLLGYVIESEAIDDPVQTARVQFLRLPGETHWLELVAPLGPESKLAGALAKGGGLNHMGYEVVDLAAAAAHFRARKCFMVSAPVAAAAFPGRRIAWFMDRRRFLFELVEAGAPPLSCAALTGPRR
jgi:methylmalonyl-CoA/ethylmalonyl-CoA epimerase